MRVAEPTDQNLCLFVDEFIYELCEAFANKYFGEDADINVVGEHTEGMMNGPLFVNDFFFSIEDVYTAMRFDIPYDCLIKWYDTADEKGYHPLNLKNFYFNSYK